MNKSDIKLIIILFVFLLLVCLIMYIFKDDGMKQAKVYYEDKDILKTKADDEPNIPDVETLTQNNTSDIND